MSKASTEELIAQLESRNGWTRDTASRLVFERQDRSAIGPLERLAAESKLPLARMHAVYALAGLGALRAETLLARLADGDPRVREHAVRLAEGLAGHPELRAKLMELAGDPDMRVRYQLAFTLGEVDDARRFAALAAILKRDPEDKWVRLAALSSLARGAGEVLVALSADRNWRSSAAGRKLLAELSRYIGRQNRREEVAQVAAVLESLSADETALATAVVRGLAEGLAAGAGGVQTQLADVGGVKAQRVLDEMLDRARLCAADESRAPAERVDAIHLLALGCFADTAAALGELVSNRQPHEVQAAALASLSRFAEPQVGQMLIEAWPAMSPRLRAGAAESLFSRRERLQSLVEAIERGAVSPADLDPARLAALAKYPDEAIRRRTEPIVAKIKLGGRQDVIEAYRTVLGMPGDAARGRGVFQKVCASCHRLEGVGHEIAPNLASFRDRGPEAILVNVLDPNREVNPQFVNYTLVAKDGRTVTGIIAAETANSVTLRRADDATDTIERREIDELRASGLSLMPEGLEKQIDQAAMADLLAYLRSVL
jgi:putative heme-binding domain-containing protein